TRSKRDWSSDVCSSDLTLGDEIVVELWIKADKPGSVTYIEARDQNGAHISASQGANWIAETFTNGSDAYVSGKTPVPDVWTMWRSEERRVGTARTYGGA